MSIKVFVGSAMAVALLGAGVLAGSVVGTGNVSAQTSTQAQTPAATATPAPSTTNPGTNNNGNGSMGPGGMHGRGGMRGGGDFGFGGRGMGGEMWGGGATADGASRAITGTTNLITSVKSDLAYANGKMDTTDAQRWVNGADALLKSAQNANSSSQYGQAVAYANAARQLAETADSQMARKLGANTLPSYSQRPQRGGKFQSTNTTLTQAQASRILAETYNRLVTVGTQVKSASNASEATSYLTDAQNAYKAAYNSYQAGNYADAAASARLAGQLGQVAEEIANASTAPANSTTPVTVPAPNF